MKSKLSLLLLLIAGGPAAAQAPPADPMADFYANKLVISVATYWTADRYFAPDHTYRDEVTDEAGQSRASGTWTLEDGKVCITRTQPEPDQRYCNLGPGHRVGDRWTDRDPYTSNEVRFSLEPGRP